MKIGIFDSGVGGLTVLKEIVKKNPLNKYYYYGDNINVPYGNKSNETLLEYSDEIIKFLISKDVELIIIACGTISSNIYNEIKNKYKIPIIDIITPTLDYISTLEKVGVIATTNTIKSGIFDKYQNNSCPLLAGMIENDEDVNDILEDYLKNFDINYLVLGCTHYPVVDNEIKKILNVETINMGTILANKVKIKNGISKEIRLYFGKVNRSLINNIEKIIGTNYQLEELCLNYQK